MAWVAGAVPVALITRRADALGARWIVAEDDVLVVLADAILPSELSADARLRAVHSFKAWIDEYKEGAELVHGYGTSALRFQRPSPKAKWAAQLEQFRSRLSALGSRPSREQVQAVVRDELKGERIDRMPAVGQASHVAVALLAFYYGLPDANDLCYNAQIGRETCRPLAQQSRQPLPLAGAR